MKPTEIIPAFSQQDREAYTQAVTIIESAQRAADGLAEQISAELYRVKTRKLFMLDEAGAYPEKGFTAWAVDTFGMSKGTVTDSVNTFERFKATDEVAIDAKWAGYQFSTLMRIKSYTDEEIERAGITADLSRKQVLEAIESLKLLKLEDKKRADLDERLGAATSLLMEIGSEELTRSKGNRPSLAGRILNAYIEGYGKRLAKGTRTIEDIEKALEITTNLVDLCENDLEPKTIDDYEFNLSKLQEDTANEDKNEAPSVEDTETENSTESEDTDMVEALAEYNSFPSVTISVTGILHNIVVDDDATDNIVAERQRALGEHLYQYCLAVLRGEYDVMITQ